MHNGTQGTDTQAIPEIAPAPGATVNVLVGAAAADGHAKTFVLWSIESFFPNMNGEALSALRLQCLQDGRAVFQDCVTRAPTTEELADLVRRKIVTIKDATLILPEHDDTTLLGDNAFKKEADGSYAVYNISEFVKRLPLGLFCLANNDPVLFRDDLPGVCHVFSPELFIERHLHKLRFVPLAHLLKIVFRFRSDVIQHLLVFAPGDVYENLVPDLLILERILGADCPEFFKHETLCKNFQGAFLDYGPFMQLYDLIFEAQVASQYVLVAKQSHAFDNCRCVDPAALLSWSDPLPDLPSTSVSTRRVSLPAGGRLREITEPPRVTLRSSRDFSRASSGGSAAASAAFPAALAGSQRRGSVISLQSNEEDLPVKEPGLLKMLTVIYDILFGGPSSSREVLPWLSYLLRFPHASGAESYLDALVVMMRSSVILPSVYSAFSTDQFLIRSGAILELNVQIERFARYPRDKGFPGATDQRVFTEACVLMMIGDEGRPSFPECMSPQILETLSLALSGSEVAAHSVQEDASLQLSIQLMLIWLAATVNHHALSQHLNEQQRSRLTGLAKFLRQAAFRSDINPTQTVTRLLEILGKDLLKSTQKKFAQGLSPEGVCRQDFKLAHFSMWQRNEPFSELINSGGSDNLRDYVRRRLCLRLQGNQAYFIHPVLVEKPDGRLILEAVVVFSPKDGRPLTEGVVNIQGVDANHWDVVVISADPMGHASENAPEHMGRTNLCTLSREGSETIGVNWTLSSGDVYFANVDQERPLLGRYDPDPQSVGEHKGSVLAKIHDDLRELLLDNERGTPTHNSALQLLVFLRASPEINFDLCLKTEALLRTSTLGTRNSVVDETTALLESQNMPPSQTKQTAAAFYKLVVDSVGGLAAAMGGDAYDISPLLRNRFWFGASWTAIASILILYFGTDYLGYDNYDQDLWGSAKVVQQMRFDAIAADVLLGFIGTVLTAEGFVRPLVREIRRRLGLAAMRHNKLLTNMAIQAVRQATSLPAQLAGGLSLLLAGHPEGDEVELRILLGAYQKLNELASLRESSVSGEISFALSHGVSDKPIRAAVDFAASYAEYQKQMETERASLNKSQLLWFLFNVLGITGVVLFFMLELGKRLENLDDPALVGKFLVECIESTNRFVLMGSAGLVAIAGGTAAREAVGFFNRRQERLAAAAVVETVVEPAVDLTMSHDNPSAVLTLQ